MGEILLVNFQNEWQLFGADGVPFLADSYDSSMKLYGAQKPMMDKEAWRAGHDAALCGAVAAAGHLFEKPLASAADLKGSKWRAYSPQRPHCRAGRCTTGDGAGRRALAGARDQGGGELHELRFDGG